MPQASRTLRFGPFELDTRSGELRKHGTKIRLHQQPFRILLMLLAHPGEVVLREEILHSLWPADTNVEFDHGINAAVQRLRDALGDSAENPRYVETLPRRGYRFLAEVSEVTPAPALLSASAPQSSFPVVLPAPSPQRGPIFPRTTTRVAAIVAAAIGAASGLWWVSGKMRSPHPPRFEKLTFRSGAIQRARFAPDGQSVLYAASWDEEPLNIFSIQPGGTVSRSLGMPQMGLLAVSPAGELAVCAHCTLGWMNTIGTLAHVPVSGGAPREVQEDVQFADWAKDGKMALAIGGDHPRLEYPVGRVLVTKSGTAWVGDPKISPDGKTVAFADYFYNGNDGPVAIVDMQGRKRILTHVYDTLQGLVWSPNGREIWFTATENGAFNRRVMAVNLTGDVRVISDAPGNLKLHDIAADGRVLLTKDEAPSRILFQGIKEERARDLTWLTFALNPILSADGQTLLMTENDEATGGKNMVYLRRTDGSPAVRLGEGSMVGLSPDGRWVVAANLMVQPLTFSLIPVKSGDRVPFDTGSLLLAGGELPDYPGVSWTPDSKSIFFAGKEPSRAPRTFRWELTGGRPKAVTPEGLWGFLLSPGGKYLLVHDSQSKAFLYSMHEGKTTPLPLPAKFDALTFTKDESALFICDIQERPFRIHRMDLKTGTITIWREWPSETFSFLIRRPQITSDGKWLAYAIRKPRSELYVVTGFR